MRSCELPDLTGQNQHGFKPGLRSRYIDLTQHHPDFDYMSTARSCSATCDELLVARLKKRKLRIKDEITRMESGLRMTGETAAHP